MSSAGHFDHKHRLNHMNPAAQRAHLGDLLYQIVNNQNALLAHIDAAGTALVNATVTSTITNSAITAGDTVAQTITNSKILNWPLTVTYTVKAGDTNTTIAAGLVALWEATPAFTAAGCSVSNAAGVLTFDHPGTVGNSSVLTGSVTGGRVTDTIANSGALANGAGIFGTANLSTFGLTLPENWVASNDN